MKSDSKTDFNASDIPLRIKFVILFSIILALISLFILLYFPSSLEKQAIKAVVSKAATIGAMSAYNISPALYFEDAESINDLLEGIKLNPDIAYIVVTNNSDKITTSYKLDYAEKTGYSTVKETHQISPDGEVVKIMHPLFYKRKTIGRLYLGLSLVELKKSVSLSRTYIIIISVLIFILGTVSVWTISRYVTLPLQRIVETVIKITGGDYKQRVGFRSKDELGVLAGAFDDMVDKIVHINEKLEDLNRNLEQRVSERTEKLQQEIYERKLIEESLLVSEEINRGIVENSPIGIMYLDKDGIILNENRAMLEMMGTPSYNKSVVIGKNIMEIPNIKEAGAESLVLRLLSGETIKSVQLEYRSLFNIKKLLDIYAAPRFDVTGNVSGAILMCADITAYRDLEEQLRQAQKMEAVGTLAGGIAHDFNNILTGILGNIELALLEVDPNSELYYLLSQVSINAERAADLVSQLLAFGRRRMERPAPTNINISINDAVKFMKRTINPLIEIETILEPNIKIVNADSGQIHQVLINMIINSADSMPDGGRLTLISENVNIEKEYCEIHKEASEGAYIKISIRDTGAGINPQILDRIFEPFFTTKEVGKGTGLGLAMVYGIVKGHRGWIEVSSQIGEGTEFRIFLPAASTGIIEESDALEIQEDIQGCETILLVDDETSVRDLGASILGKHGYKVITAIDGMEALKIYEQYGGSIDLVIMDLTMPRKSGLQTMMEIRRINPSAKVILTSGYDRQEGVRNFKEQGAIDFIQKPFRMNRLLKAALTALESKA